LQLIAFDNQAPTPKKKAPNHHIRRFSPIFALLKNQRE
jgi:hypothetical protein